MPNYVSLAEAAAKLVRADRVMVIGCSGAGKTTLALGIADRFELEYQSLDRDVRWLPGWRVRGGQAQRQIMARLAARQRWVMDGSSPSSFDLRVPRADLIVWLRIPRSMALLGLARRVTSNYGRVRVGMAEGCPEPIPDREFLSYIWNFDRIHAPRFVEQIDRHGPEVPVLVLGSRREGTRLLQR